MSILATLTTSTALGLEAPPPPPPPPPLAAAVAEPPPTAVVAEPPASTITVAGSVVTPSVAHTPIFTPPTMAEVTAGAIDRLRPLAPGPPAPAEIIAASFARIDFARPSSVVEASEEADCIRIAKTSPLMTDGAWDRNLIARMAHGVFECYARVAGLDAMSPTALRRWNGAAKWGFGSLAEQVAAEAVVVAYCESEGFSPRALTGSNAFGYAGLFQMGSREMARFGEPGASRYDPADNAVGAAKYFIHQFRNGGGWGGWSPWAVVNTNFDDEFNSQVKVPVLPRFTSTDPEFRGRPGQELPAWAVDPWSWEVPHWRGTGCSFTGRPWPAPHPLAETTQTQG